MKLFGGKEKVFPEFIIIDGEYFAINADFRNILRIFAMMKDGNISDLKKIYKLREWFLLSDKPVESSRLIQAFTDFINDGKATNQGTSLDNSDVTPEHRFCYEFDGEEIYASFLSEYNIDLITCEFLHWYQFKIMLLNLSESSAFMQKLALRFLNLSRFSRSEPGFSDIFRAWKSVQLPAEDDECDEETSREAQEFKEFWERV